MVGLSDAVHGNKRKENAMTKHRYQPSAHGSCRYCRRDLIGPDGGMWIKGWGIYLCLKCIRMGSTEGFTPWIGNAIAAELAAKGLPAMTTHPGNGFFMLPDRL
jgi:hypothetical protein